MWTMAVLYVAGMLTMIPRAPQQPTFAVATVNLSRLDNRIRGADFSYDSFAVSGATLRMLVQYAYRLNQSTPIVRGPSWIDPDLFDIQAKVQCGSGPVLEDQVW